ncbi:MAG TPA: PKD domain-containing protein [Longimicrobium sp.]|nr:PKD domain-containing protein [Longimicrobium sp.]
MAIAAVLGLTALAACGDTTASLVRPPRPRPNLVGNHPPVASAHVQEFKRAEGRPLLFYSTGSYDPDGDQVSYSWNFGDGTTGDGYEVVHTYADNGTYTVTLTVSDGFGKTGTSTLSLPISNRSPVPGTLTTSGPLLEGQGFTLSTTPATDGPADAVHGLLYSYYCGGPKWSAFTTNTNWPCPARPDNGTYAVGVTVLDKDGASGSRTQAIPIANLIPVTTVRVASLVGPQLVSLQYAFTDAPGDLYNATLSIDWGDGSAPITGKAWANTTYRYSHHYLGGGNTYIISITATDKDGGRLSDVIPVYVPSHDDGSLP